MYYLCSEIKDVDQMLNTNTHFLMTRFQFYLTEQADPFGIHTVSCSVSNKADFTVVNAAEDASVEFIEEAGGGS